MRLSPLRQVELILHKRLGVDSSSGSSIRSDQLERILSSSSSSRQPDLTVKVRSGWKALARIQRPTSSANQDELQDTRQIIDACRDDIIALWADEAVQVGLRERKIDLEDHCILSVVSFQPPETRSDGEQLLEQCLPRHLIAIPSVDRRYPPCAVTDHWGGRTPPGSGDRYVPPVFMRRLANAATNSGFRQRMDILRRRR